MAVTTESFRSALHGFNRTDVVQFIQRQTAEHEKELRLLQEENARLREALDAARQDAEQAHAECDDLRAQASERPAERLPQAEEAPEPISALDAPMTPPVSVAAAAPASFDELELAAYRRAELTERMARERAAASEERMKSIFTQADEKLTLTSQDIATAYDSIKTDFDRLSQLLATALSIVGESSEGLRDAAELTSEI